MIMKKRQTEIRRLVLAKKLYLHGCSHASNKDEISRMLAIHNFDNAVEMILKCIAIKKSVSSNQKYFYFEELLNKIKDLPFKEQIRNLHSLRNGIQHGGDIPDPDSVIKYKGYVEDFFRKIAEDEFNVPYNELYLSELIQNKILKEKMKKAEEQLGKDEFRKCIESCEETIITATFAESSLFFSAGLLAAYWGASVELKNVLEKNYAEKFKDKEFYEFAEDISKAISQLCQASTSVQFLDEYRMEFLNHRRIIENIESLSEEELKEGAKSSINFVTGIILKWEQQGIIMKKD